MHYLRHYCYRQQRTVQIGQVHNMGCTSLRFEDCCRSLEFSLFVYHVPTQVLLSM